MVIYDDEFLEVWHDLKIHAQLGELEPGLVAIGFNLDGKAVSMSAYLNRKKRGYDSEIDGSRERGKLQESSRSSNEACSISGGAASSSRDDG